MGPSGKIGRHCHNDFLLSNVPLGTLTAQRRRKFKKLCDKELKRG